MLQHHINLTSSNFYWIIVHNEINILYLILWIISFAIKVFRNNIRHMTNMKKPVGMEYSILCECVHQNAILPLCKHPFSLLQIDCEHVYEMSSTSFLTNKRSSK